VPAEHTRCASTPLEHHGERPVAQRLVELVALEPILDPAGARDQILEFVEGEIADLQEMLRRRGGHGVSAVRRRRTIL
jgi:hypothetical protein